MSLSLSGVTAEMISRYATAAPRYTSYPTAVDWLNQADLGNYDQRLARAGREGGPISVYVHLPFCEHLCLFCGCNVHITHNRTKSAHYLDVLLREIEAVGRTGLGVRPLTQLHYGGGTPTFFSADELTRLSQAIFAVFKPEPGAEIGLEVDPRVTTEAQIRGLASLGFHRLSLGVQDFDPQVQAAINRIQSVEETRRVVDVGRACGFRSVNIDLIYGLPYQTREGFQRTMDEVLQMRPERVALFHYAHVPWLKKHQTALEVGMAPDPLLKLRIFVDALHRFVDAGYDYLGLDHFALPEDEMAKARRMGTLKRNFMGYGTRANAEMLGLGVSAIGEIDGAFWQNDPSLEGYERRVLDGGFAVHKCHELEGDDELRRSVIMGLMCQGELAKSAIERRFGIRFDATFATELAELAHLAKDGLVELHSDRIVVTNLGQLFLRNVAVVFDRYYRARLAATGAPKSTFSRTL